MFPDPSGPPRARPDPTPETLDMADDTSMPADVMLAVVVDGLTFVATFPAGRAEALMDAFERRVGLAEGDRLSTISHMRVRLMACEDLRGSEAWDTFQERTAACCLWLALRHHTHGKTISRNMLEQVASGRPAVLTATVGHAEGAMPGTAWGFMLGEGVHDASAALATRPHSQVTLVERGDDGLSRETMVTSNVHH